MRYHNTDHSFIICAYQESPYLEACIRSVLSQTVKSDVKLVTSTPNAYIQKVANRYGLPLIINKFSSGIADDWNFAIHTAETLLVTIAHQDDIYGKHYT